MTTLANECANLQLHIKTLARLLTEEAHSAQYNEQRANELRAECLELKEQLKAVKEERRSLLKEVGELRANLMAPSVREAQATRIGELEGLLRKAQQLSHSDARELESRRALDERAIKTGLWLQFFPANWGDKPALRAEHGGIGRTRLLETGKTGEAYVFLAEWLNLLKPETLDLGTLVHPGEPTAVGAVSGAALKFGALIQSNEPIAKADVSVVSRTISGADEYQEAFELDQAEKTLDLQMAERGLDL
jgi:hypothetical protein